MSKVGVAVRHLNHPQLGVGLVKEVGHLGGQKYYRCLWSKAPLMDKFICSHVLIVI